MKIGDLKQLIENAGYETRSYSVRGMYGKECLGFKSEHKGLTIVLNLIREALGSETQFIEELVDTLDRMKYDSMGLDYIYYFPKIAFKEEE